MPDRIIGKDKRLVVIKNDRHGEWRETLSLSEGEYKARCERLKERGLLEEADWLYPLKVALPRGGRQTIVRVPGASREWDVLLRLASDDKIEAPQLYRFINWPRNLRNEECFACEIDGRVLELENIREQRTAGRRIMQSLYGCPQPCSLEELSGKKTTELLRYDG